MKRNKKYIVTIDDDYLQVLYRQGNADTLEKKGLILKEIIKEVKSFLRGETSLLFVWNAKYGKSIYITTLPNPTLRDYRRQNKRTRII